MRYATAVFVDQLNSVPSTHMRCRMTASLRATATLALRSPLRLASLIPHAFSRGGSGAAEISNTAPLGADTSQQPLLTTPQHA